MKDHRLSKKTPEVTLSPARGRLMMIGLFLLLIGVMARLAYWQVLKSNPLRAEAQSQYQQTIINTGRRGQILTADGYPLVENTQVYRLFAEPPLFKESPSVMATQLLPLLLPELKAYRQASEA